MFRWLMSMAALTLAVSCSTAVDHEAHKNRLIAHTLVSTVKLISERPGGVRRSGSAVVLSVDGQSGRSLLLTTAHLLEPPAEQIVYAVAPRTAERFKAKVLSVDAAVDLALIEAPDIGAAAVTLASSTTLGDEVWVVAFPWGRNRTVVAGAVSQIAWTPSPDISEDDIPVSGPARLIDASVSYGMSGGGVFDGRTGEVIGIVRGYRTAQLSFAGANGKPIRFPVAGETTVISTATIACFVRAVATEEIVPAGLGSEADC